MAEDVMVKPRGLQITTRMKLAVGSLVSENAARKRALEFSRLADAMPEGSVDSELHIKAAKFYGRVARNETKKKDWSKAVKATARAASHLAKAGRLDDAIHAYHSAIGILNRNGRDKRISLWFQIHVRLAEVHVFKAKKAENEDERTKENEVARRVYVIAARACERKAGIIENQNVEQAAILWEKAGNAYEKAGFPEQAIEMYTKASDGYAESVRNRNPEENKNPWSYIGKVDVGEESF